MEYCARHRSNYEYSYVLIGASGFPLSQLPLID